MSEQEHLGTARLCIEMSPFGGIEIETASRKASGSDVLHQCEDLLAPLAKRKLKTSRR